MRVPHGCLYFAALLGVLAAPGRAEPMPTPPLFDLCYLQPAAALDVSIESAEDSQVTGVVNAVYARTDRDGGGPAVDVSVDDSVTVPGWCGSWTSAGARALLLLDDLGDCVRAFEIDDDGILEDSKPDTVTSEEAGAAAISGDCEDALHEAGYDPPVYEESPLVRLFGCASTAAPDGLSLLSLLFLLALARSRRRRPCVARGGISNVMGR